MIELHNIYKNHGALAAVADVSLEVKRGESAVLLGHSGSGKTTLLRIVAGLDLPDSGTVCVKGRIGMVFQSLALWPHATVQEQIELVLHGPRWSGAEKTARVAEMLDVFGLVSWAGRKPGTLSGGEQQRVALARAVAADPEILLLDEPLAHLDGGSRRELRERLRPMLDGRAVLIATHDEEDARVLSQRCLRMQEGRIV